MSASRWRTIGLGLLLLAVLALGMAFAPRSADYFVYASTAKRVLDHDYDLYRQGGLAFRYAPVVAFAFVPWSFLPRTAGAFLWYLLKIAALLAIVRMTMLLMDLEKRTFWKILAITSLATAGFLFEEFHTGNIHFLVLFLIVLALFYAERGRSVLPSFLLAAVICIKLTPLLFVAYFAIARRWKICLLCFLWLAVLVLAPSFFVGWPKNLELTKHWAETALARTEEPVNHSLRGVLFKYLSDKPNVAETEKYPSVNLFNLRPDILNGLWILTSIALLLVLGSILLRKCPDRECAVLKYALLTVSLLLLSPHDSRIYFSTLFFPCAVLAGMSFKLPLSKHRNLAIAVLGISFALNTLFPALLPGKKISLAYETLSPYFYTFAAQNPDF
jgi:hypothetical protein